MFSGNLSGLPEPEVTWFTPDPEYNGDTKLGDIACGYKHNNSTGEKFPFCRIRLNECLREHPEELIHTYLHELAHHVDWMSDQKWEGHKGEWKDLAKEWDLVDYKADSKVVIPGCTNSINRGSRIK